MSKKILPQEDVKTTKYGDEEAEKEQKIITIPISEIVVREDLYPRLDGPSESTIEEYAENLGKLPPPTINQDKILIDGLHDIRAHEREGISKIKVIVEHTKNDEEILLRAIELNAKHGLPLSNKDKKRLAIRLFSKSKGKNAKLLAKRFSVTQDCFNKWVREARQIMSQEIEENIINDYLTLGLSQKEIAEKFDVHDTKVTELKEEILKKINLLISKKDDASKDLKQEFQEIANFKPQESDVWNEVLVTKWDTTKISTNIDILFGNLLHHYTEPFDVVYDFTQQSANICKKWYRRYIPATEKTIFSKTPQLVFLDTELERFESIVKNVKPKMKNGYVAVLTHDKQQIFLVTEMMYELNADLEGNIILLYPNAVDEGRKLKKNFESLLIFSFEKKQKVTKK